MSTAASLTCPRCGIALARVGTPHGLAWSCGNCRGRAVGAAVFRAMTTHRTHRQLWDARETVAGARCPACARAMRSVAVLADAGTLDACRNCQFVWLDPGDEARLPTPVEAQGAD